MGCFDRVLVVAGLAAWYADRPRVEAALVRLGRPKRNVDWLAVSGLLFLLGALLEVVDCWANDAGLNLVAQLCWLMNGLVFVVDAYGNYSV